ncbi:hypothetical protein QJS10_CPB21g00545 [Acorus calamus]|uniref:FAD dependent oxidoreductase domain-containing protein n=1 Tax=Acorus calamus TaxID=4465 RepID=A0AAV9C7K8_ACOCL|nr:hypothetical protein QJS10_CPB21g00545 [Acorus calamus]
MGRCSVPGEGCVQPGLRTAEAGLPCARGAQPRHAKRAAYVPSPAHAHPCYSWFDVVYYWAGLKAYDLVAGTRVLRLSRYFSADKAVGAFPTLAGECGGRQLRGAVVYYDGQMDDSRLNVGLACTAALAGAAVMNHAAAVDLRVEWESGRVVGARIQDKLTGEEFDVYAQVVVNATGPFCDAVRHSDILSLWSGLRPLASDPSANNTLIALV